MQFLKKQDVVNTVGNLPHESFPSENTAQVYHNHPTRRKNGDISFKEVGLNHRIMNNTHDASDLLVHARL